MISKSIGFCLTENGKSVVPCHNKDSYYYACYSEKNKRLYYAPKHKVLESFKKRKKNIGKKFKVPHKYPVGKNWQDLTLRPQSSLSTLILHVEKYKGYAGLLLQPDYVVLDVDKTPESYKFFLEYAQLNNIGYQLSDTGELKLHILFKSNYKIKGTTLAYIHGFPVTIRSGYSNNIICLKSNCFLKFDDMKNIEDCFPEILNYQAGITKTKRKNKRGQTIIKITYPIDVREYRYEAQIHYANKNRKGIIEVIKKTLTKLNENKMQTSTYFISKLLNLPKYIVQLPLQILSMTETTKDLPIYLREENGIKKDGFTIREKRPFDKDIKCYQVQKNNLKKDIITKISYILNTCLKNDEKRNNKGIEEAIFRYDTLNKGTIILSYHISLYLLYINNYIHTLSDTISIYEYGGGVVEWLYLSPTDKHRVFRN